MKIEIFFNRSWVTNHVAARFYNSDLSGYIALDFFGPAIPSPIDYYRHYSCPTDRYIVLESSVRLDLLQDYLHKNYNDPTAFNILFNNCTDAVFQALRFCRIPILGYMSGCSCARLCCCFCIPWHGVGNPTELFSALQRYVRENNVPQTMPPHDLMRDQHLRVIDHFPKQIVCSSLDSFIMM